MNYVVVKPLKSYGISILLVLIFGPFGLFYASILGGLLLSFIVPALCLIGFLKGIFASDLLLIFSSLIILCISYYIVCLIWAVTGVYFSNKRIQGHAISQLDAYVLNEKNKPDSNYQKVKSDRVKDNKLDMDLPKDVPRIGDWLSKNPGKTINDFYIEHKH